MERKIIWVLALVLSLGLTGFASAAFAEEKEEWEYWDETDLKIDHLTNLAHDTFCHSEKSAYVACVMAAKEMAEGMVSEEVSVALFSRAFIESHPNLVKKEIAVYAPLILVELNPRERDPKKSAMAAFKEERKLQQDIENSLMELSKEDKTTSFASLIKTFDSKIVEAKKRKLYISNGINSLFHAAEDPHTRIEPARLTEMGLNQNPDFGGIGASLRVENSRAVIDSFLEGSSAKTSGAKEEDSIIEIDNTPTTGKTLNQVVNMLRGEVGTTVVVKVLRKGQEVTLDIVRKKVVIQNVTGKLVNHMGATYGLVRINGFKNKTCMDLFNQVGTLKQKSEDKMKGLLLDLRGNPGGLMGEASCIGHLFVGENKRIVSLRNFQGKPESFHDFIVTGGKPKAVVDYFLGLPLVILIDGGSASASEIVAGAMQDYGRAWVVGEKSFGKGTAQGVIPSEDPKVSEQLGLPPGLMYIHTSSRFYLPSGTSNQIIGLSPEFEVPYKPDATEEERFRRREADLFSNAITQVTALRPNMRYQVVNQLKPCVAQGKAEKLYSDLVTQNQLGDYQVIKAQEIFECSLNASQPNQLMVQAQ